MKNQEKDERDTQVRRAFATYRALTAEQQHDVDERSRQLAERDCWEKNKPLYDVWTRVAGGDLYDVGRAWAHAFGRSSPILPLSVTFARARDRRWIETIYDQHQALMDEVAPRRSGES